MCDTVLFVLSAALGGDHGDDTVDDWGKDILLSSFAQVFAPLLVFTRENITLVVIGPSHAHSGNNRS